MHLLLRVGLFVKNISKIFDSLVGKVGKFNSENRSSTRLQNVTVFWKTNLMVTNAEIHFLLVDESHTHALSRDTKHLSLDSQVCFYRRLFYNAG